MHLDAFSAPPGDSLYMCNHGLLGGNAATALQNTSVVESFQRLIQLALGRKIVTVNDLNILMGSLNPLNPLQNDFGYERISLRDGFDQIVKHVTPADWLLIQKRLQSSMTVQQDETVRIQEAQKKTEFLFNGIPLSFSEIEGAESGRGYATSRGEVFIPVASQNHLAVFNLVNRTATRLGDGTSSDCEE